MARNFPKSGLSSGILFFIFFSINISVDGKPKTFSKSLNPATFGLKKEKLTHFRVYWHDIFSGTKPTAVQVAAGQSTNTSSTLFGALVVFDNPLTEGPELSSKLVGKSQGIYAFASQNEMSLIMAMNFAFMEGKYNGSTITILGRNSIFSKVREMPVVGGSGLFRFARGYALAKTYKFDPTNADATVEYNIYVLHY